MDVAQNDIVVAISSLLLGYAYDTFKGKESKKRKVWVKSWIAARELNGAYNALITELSLSEREDYRKFMRMKDSFINKETCSDW